MRLGKMLAAVAASTLVAAPVMAAPAVSNPASALSVAKAASVKPTTSARKGNKLEGGTGVVLAVAAAAAVGLGIYAAVDDGGSDSN